MKLEEITDRNFNVKQFISAFRQGHYDYYFKSPSNRDTFVKIRKDDKVEFYDYTKGIENAIYPIGQVLFDINNHIINISPNRLQQIYSELHINVARLFSPTVTKDNFIADELADSLLGEAQNMPLNELPNNYVNNNVKGLPYPVGQVLNNITTTPTNDSSKIYLNNKQLQTIYSTTKLNVARLLSPEVTQSNFIPDEFSDSLVHALRNNHLHKRVKNVSIKESLKDYVDTDSHWLAYPLGQVLNNITITPTSDSSKIQLNDDDIDEIYANSGLNLKRIVTPQFDTPNITNDNFVMAELLKSLQHYQKTVIMNAMNQSQSQTMYHNIPANYIDEQMNPPYPLGQVLQSLVTEPVNDPTKIYLTKAQISSLRKYPGVVVQTITQDNFDFATLKDEIENFIMSQQTSIIPKRYITTKTATTDSTNAD